MDTHPLAPWRGLVARAQHRNRSKRHTRYLQLATVRPDGTPANRTVVFRGFVDERNDLRMVTDRRSQKIDDLAHQPWAEACWYFTKTREQFRLRGPVRVVTASVADEAAKALRDQAWQALSQSGQAAFLGPCPGDARQEAALREAAGAHAEQAPDTFCLLLLHPWQVDHLELRPTPQARTVFARHEDGTWTQEAVNP